MVEKPAKNQGGAGGENPNAKPGAAPAPKLGAALAEMLRLRGVDTIFGIPGVHNIELYRGIEQAGITHVLARHEQGAGFMADGYARATGKPGVAFVITGPGLTNIMTPMGQAWSDSVPMLVISSCLPPDSDTPGQLHQMRDQTGAAGCVCDWSQLAGDGETAFGLIDRAFAEFASQRPRPKHVSIPIDVLAAPAPPPPPAPPAPAPLPAAESSEIARLAARLASARRPLFIFGGGARKAAEAARALLARSGAASFTTYAGRGIPAPDDPLAFGAALARPDSARIIAQADLVVVVGSELAQVDLWRDQLGHAGTLARIDIDPTVLDDAHGATLRIRADAGAALTALGAALADAALAEAATPDAGPKWDAGEVARIRAAFHAETDAERPGIAPWARALRAALPEDAQIFSDMTQFAYVAKEIVPQPGPGLWHHPFGFGTLGYALPAAIGARAAPGGGAVVAIAGDYGFQYTHQELGTAVELGRPLPIVLWDNGKLKEIEDAMVRAQIAPNAVIARNPDFALLARSYGIAYCAPASPEGPDGLDRALRDALDRAGPTLIHLRAPEQAA